MTESTLLDALLAAIIVLVALIGYWQGIVRSQLLICGALIGSELALWWSDTTGDWLADVLPFSEGTGRFVASNVLILGSSLMLGVLPGTMVLRPATGIRDRLGGVAVSLGAALLIIGLVIRYFHIHMAARAEDAFSDTRLALALWEQFDWIVLISAVSGVAAVILFWVLGSTESSRNVNVRTSPGDARAGNALASGRQSPRKSFAEHTPVDQVRRASNNDYSVYGANDGTGSREIHQAAPAPRSTVLSQDRSSAVAEPVENKSRTDDHDIGAGARASAVRPPGTSSAAFERQYAPVAETLAFSDDHKAPGDNVSSGMCPNCGMLLTSGDQFCPDCGRAVE
jgi:uncharacterized membrane protein required for colicin V production